MRIALLAPFEETVPPRRYGGTERIVAQLADTLVGQGHDVTLLASGDSDTKAKLQPCVARAIRVLPAARDYFLRNALNLSGLAEAISIIQQGDFEIIHNHFGWQFLLFSHLVSSPIISTLHGTLDKAMAPTEHYVFNQYRQLPYVSISNAQRRHAPRLNYISTVYNGIDVATFSFNAKPDNYLAFLGRTNPQKGLDYAIQIAKNTGNRLVIAAKVDPLDMEYFERQIKPQIDGRQIVFIGEVSHRQKVRLLRNAKALLSPIQWDEPFGLTNIEAMACGTPVIAIRRGSLPEIVSNNRTGFLCSDIEGMQQSIAKLSQINRMTCRRRVAKLFSAKSMADNYLKAYALAIQANRQGDKNQ